MGRLPNANVRKAKIATNKRITGKLRLNLRVMIFSNQVAGTYLCACHLTNVLQIRSVVSGEQRYLIVAAHFLDFAQKFLDLVRMFHTDAVSQFG